MKLRSRSRGIAFIEWLFIAAIVGILAVIAISTYNNHQERKLRPIPETRTAMIERVLTNASTGGCYVGIDWELRGNEVAELLSNHPELELSGMARAGTVFKKKNCEKR